MKLELSIHASENETEVIELYLRANDLKFVIKEIYGVLLNSENIGVARQKTKNMIQRLELGDLLGINVQEV